MLPPGHFAAGFLVARSLLALATPALSTQQTNWLLLTGAFFGFAPDLDMFYAFYEEGGFHHSGAKFNHRQFITHAPLIWLLVALIVFLFTHSAFGHYFALLIWLGSWSHFVLDSGYMGIRWLYPFSKKFYALRTAGISEENTAQGFFNHWWNLVKLYYQKDFFVFCTEAILIVVALITFFLVPTNSPAPILLTRPSTENWSVIQTREIAKLQTIAKKNGVVAAFSYLKQTWGKTPVKAHIFAHEIGKLAYQQLGNKAFEVCDQSFAFGCYHGLIIALMTDQGDKGLIIAQQACGSLATTQAQTGCFHGMGHGMMEWQGDIPLALAECKKLDSKEHNNCFDGVYMDYDMDIMHSFHQSVSTAKPWAFCDSAPADAYPWCIRNHTILLLASHAIPPTSTIEGCLHLPENGRSMCESSIGIFDADNRKLSVPYVQGRCGLLKNVDDVSYCIASAVKELTFDPNPARILIAQQLCAGLTPAWAAQCMRLLPVAN